MRLILIATLFSMVLALNAAPIVFDDKTVEGKVHVFCPSPNTNEGGEFAHCEVSFFNIPFHGGSVLLHYIDGTEVSDTLTLTIIQGMPNETILIAEFSSDAAPERGQAHLTSDMSIPEDDVVKNPDVTPILESLLGFPLPANTSVVTLVESEAPVPEPGTLWLFVIGIAIVWLMMRRGFGPARFL